MASFEQGDQNGPSFPQTNQEIMPIHEQGVNLASNITLLLSLFSLGATCFYFGSPSSASHFCCLCGGCISSPSYALLLTSTESSLSLAAAGKAYLTHQDRTWWQYLRLVPCC